MRDYDWYKEQDWYDVDDETYDFYCHSSERKKKYSAELSSKPRQVMERQNLPIGHKDRVSFEERLYRFYRNYRVDAENGRVRCSDADYYCALRHENYYYALEHGVRVYDKESGWEYVPITRSDKAAFLAGTFTYRHKA